MKIVFVCAEDEMPGVCYLSAFLKKHGHQVNLIFDPKQFDRAYIRNEKLAHFFSQARVKDNLAEIKKIKPDLIGFSCTTAHYQWALNYAKIIKKHFLKIPIIFGGVHPTMVPDLVLKEKCIDFVCISEGEAPLLELLERLKNHESTFPIQNIWYKTKKGVIKKNQLRPLNQDLDSMPYIDKELFRGHLPEHYFTHTYFFTSRGCPFNCSYCGIEQMRKIVAGLGKFIRRMSPERAVSELEILKNKYGAKYVLFEDDVFAMDVNWLSEFIPLYKKRVGLKFTCFGHVKLLTPKIIKLLKKGGCDMLWFGLQSANQDIRRNVFQRYETNDEVIKAADLCHKEHIRFMVDHILNIPYDTHEAMIDALHLYNRIRPGIINCYNLLYFPKAKINDIALKAGMIKKSDIALINQGRSRVYQTGELIAHQKDFYADYALMISAIPLLPKWFVSLTANHESLIGLFGKMPLFLVPIVKVILNIREGRGFLPFAILKMEIYFTKQFFSKKLFSYFFA